MSTPDPELCERYARFASHMDRWQFNVIYWTMFVTNLLVLFLASWIYTRGQEAAERLKDDEGRRSRTLRTYMALCFGCVVASTVIVVVEVYALMALQFCDGEDLISLYWSTWTMIQVGSLIAMVGIILAMLHSLKNSRHPPWALALGTPVLVIAGFLHLFHLGTKTNIKKIKEFASTKDDDDRVGPPMSQANTIQAPDDDSVPGELVGELVGFTVEGGPIVRFGSPLAEASLPGSVEVLGRCGEKPIVAYSKDSIRFVSR